MSGPEARYDLDHVIDSIRRDFHAEAYRIPSRWTRPLSDTVNGISSFIVPRDDGTVQIQDVSGFYLKIFAELGKQQSFLPPGSHWLPTAVVYGMYVRHALAFDHDGDGVLGGDAEDVTLNAEGIRETGTFLKAMILLPYLMAMGFNTVYLLPVSRAGKAFRKRELSSPYAVQDPFAIDDELSDPLCMADASVQFGAFVETAHRLGIRVCLDFPLRTTSRDAHWVTEYPEWYYWIREKDNEGFTSPAFSNAELKTIHQEVGSDSAAYSVIPSEAYRQQFMDPPQQVSNVGDFPSGANSEGETCLVPGAFADWPPDDVQPAWSDITYLKLYRDQAFNYTAYNTLRMYDERLSEPNVNLWDMLTTIIPHYVERYHIDAARIDMGHALPRELEQRVITATNHTRTGPALICEEFDANSVDPERGYHVAWGDFWYQVPRLLNQGTYREVPAYVEKVMGHSLLMLGAPETFDTPRAATREHGLVYARQALILAFVMPNLVPFVNAGLEIAESQPGNLGLDFTKQQIKEATGPLALFERASLNWTSSTSLGNLIYTLTTLREHVARGYQKPWLNVRSSYDDQLLELEYTGRFVVQMLHPEAEAPLSNVFVGPLLYHDRHAKDGSRQTLQPGEVAICRSLSPMNPPT